MTLVIDNTQDILKAKPEFMATLQKFAKGAADAGDLRVVFVSNDCTALAHMRALSEWSRCTSVEVGEADIGESAAIAYLTSLLGWALDDKAAQEAASESARPHAGSVTRPRFPQLRARCFPPAHDA